MIQDILCIVRGVKDAMIAGDYARLNAVPFNGYTLSTSPNGSIVVALKLTPEASAQLPPDQRTLDLFILGANNQLGRHYHHHASAHVHFVSGYGTAEVDDIETKVGPGDTLFFPARSIHNVRSAAETVLFASFQDNPILQPDGSADYYAVT